MNYVESYSMQEVPVESEEVLEYGIAHEKDPFKIAQEMTIAGAGVGRAPVPGRSAQMGWKVAAFGPRRSYVEISVLDEHEVNGGSIHPVVSERAVANSVRALAEYAVASPGSLQLVSLDLIGAQFSPSNDLVRYWIDGVRYHNKIALVDNQEALLRTVHVTSSLRKTFADRIRIEIANYVQNIRARRDKKATTSITFIVGGKVAPWCEHMMMNLFEIRPRDAPQFLDQVSSELMNFFSLGGSFEGSWGQTISNTHGNIDIVVCPQKTSRNRKATAFRIDL